MMLTNMKLYNVKKTELQRTIDLTSLCGMTKSIGQKQQTSFIVHIQNEYDYIFDSDFRDDIFNQIKYYYWAIMKRNLPVYVVKEGIDQFVTKKTDIQKDIEIKPNESCRSMDEDIYPEEKGNQPTPKTMNP